MKQANKKLKVLIVDDEPGIRESLTGVMEDEGCQAWSVADGAKALIESKLNPPDLIFLDIWMPGIDGITTLQKLRELIRDVPIVIMSGHATIETAVKATRLGAFDVLEKPLELQKIISLLEQAKILIEKRTESQGVSVDLIGVSSPILMLRKHISAVGPKNASVLITGENGTGKEVVARMIHRSSPRSGAPFVAINCAAIPDELIEAELFGHVKGAFTNAITDRKGRFESASGGTIFLDEVGDMSIKTQAKILRILQEKVFERVGDHKSIRVDVRIIAATNRDLALEIQNGRFREDLFYRLNVIPIKLLPLRERREDIPHLVQHFLAVMSRDQEKQYTISDRALNALLEYSWPGNIRQLKNTLERVVIMMGGAEINFSDLPDELLSQTDDISAELKTNQTLREAKSDFERTFILDKLEENDWNISKTAEVLNIERSNLHRKLKSFEIDPKKIKGD